MGSSFDKAELLPHPTKHRASAATIAKVITIKVFFIKTPFTHSNRNGLKGFAATLRGIPISRNSRYTTQLDS